MKAFPYIPEQPRLIEALADFHSEEPISNLTQAAGLDDAEYHACWRQVSRYLEGVSADNLHLHVSFCAEWDWNGRYAWWCTGASSAGKKKEKRRKTEEKERLHPFGVTLMRSQVLYQAAQIVQATCCPKMFTICCDQSARPDCGTGAAGVSTAGCKNVLSLKVYYVNL